MSDPLYLLTSGLEVDLGGLLSLDFSYRRRIFDSWNSKRPPRFSEGVTAQQVAKAAPPFSSTTTTTTICPTQGGSTTILPSSLSQPIKQLPNLSRSGSYLRIL